MVAHIVNQLKETGMPIAFFYFKHADETKTSMAGLLRAILVQLICEDDCLIEHFYQKCCSANTAELRSVPRLKELILEAIEPLDRLFLVLDGLDEAQYDTLTSRDVGVEAITWIQNSVFPLCSNTKNIRILFSGQRTGNLEKCLDFVPHIRLDDEGSHTEDIRLFTRSKVSAIQEKFDLDAKDSETLVKKVSQTARGELSTIGNRVLCYLILIVLRNVSVRQCCAGQSPISRFC